MPHTQAGGTPLMWAMYYGNAEAVKLLLQHEDVDLNTIRVQYSRCVVVFRFLSHVTLFCSSLLSSCHPFLLSAALHRSSLAFCYDVSVQSNNGQGMTAVGMAEEWRDRIPAISALVLQEYKDRTQR